MYCFVTILNSEVVKLKVFIWNNMATSRDWENVWKQMGKRSKKIPCICLINCPFQFNMVYRLLVKYAKSNLN